MIFANCFAICNEVFQHCCCCCCSFISPNRNRFLQKGFLISACISICVIVQEPSSGDSWLFEISYSALVAPLRACIPSSLVFLLILPPGSICEALGADQAPGGGGGWSCCELFLSTHWLQESLTQLTNPKKSHSWENQTSQPPNSVATGRADNERGKNPRGFAPCWAQGSSAAGTGGLQVAQGTQRGAQPSHQWCHQPWLFAQSFGRVCRWARAGLVSFTSSSMSLSSPYDEFLFIF